MDGDTRNNYVNKETAMESNAMILAFWRGRRRRGGQKPDTVLLLHCTLLA